MHAPFFIRLCVFSNSYNLVTGLFAVIQAYTIVFIVEGHYRPLIFAYFCDRRFWEKPRRFKVPEQTNIH